MGWISDHPFTNEAAGGPGGSGVLGGSGGNNAWVNELVSASGSGWLAQDANVPTRLYSEIKPANHLATTRDGSGTWTDLATFPPASFVDLKASFAVASGNFYALAFGVNPMVVWQSTNQGTSWTGVSTSSAAANPWTANAILSAIAGTGGQDFIVTGDPTGLGQVSAIYGPTPALTYADRLASNIAVTPSYLFTAAYDTSNQYFVAASVTGGPDDTKSGLFFSSGGVSWAELGGAAFTRAFEFLNDIWAADARVIYVCTGSNAGDPSRIYKSTNNGTTWTVDYQVTGTETPFATPASELKAIHGNSAGSVWCVGTEGIILRAPTFGAWAVDPVAPVQSGIYNDVKVLPTRVYVAGPPGVIAKTLS